MREPAVPVEVPDEGPGEPGPVQRQRLARPAPRPAPPPPDPEPTPAPVESPVEVDTLPDVSEVVDAEIVATEPVEVPASSRERKAVALVQMHWQRLGVTDRAERLWYTSVLARREVESTNDLTGEELHELLTRLERAKDIDAVNAMIPRGETPS